VREPEGQTGRGAFSFGYFSLGMQRKVTRHQAKPNVNKCDQQKYVTNVILMKQQKPLYSLCLCGKYSNIYPLDSGKSFYSLKHIVVFALLCGLSALARIHIYHASIVAIADYC